MHFPNIPHHPLCTQMVVPNRGVRLSDGQGGRSTRDGFVLEEWEQAPQCGGHRFFPCDLRRAQLIGDGGVRPCGKKVRHFASRIGKLRQQQT